MSPADRPKPCGALPLPLELFLAFKEAIPLTELRTHVCFYKADARIAALYDSEAQFWQRACWDCGVGALPSDDLDDPQCWRDIALDIVERDGFCTHPQCGEGLMAYNRERMARTRAYIKPLVVLPPEVDARGARGGPDMHRALTQSTFRSVSGSSSVDQEAVFRSACDAQGIHRGSALLKHHPLIMRSFATDVPVGSLRIGRVGGHDLRAGKVERPLGVTVHDVLAVLSTDLDETLSSDALLHFLMAMFDRLPADWPACVAAERLHTMRGLLDVCHFGEYVYDGSDGNDGPSFSIRLQSGR